MCWSEFLVPKNINPGLIIFKKDQHYTHKFQYTSVVVKVVDVFGRWCEQVAIISLAVPCATLNAS
jgi:hypothetical protein